MDICMNCGTKHETVLWGAPCTCDAPNVVHLESCGKCGNPIGQIIYDDFCGPEKIYCSDCIRAVEQNRREADANY